jgi:redox-regulated HSP33 family molecular chaperone
LARQENKKMKVLKLIKNIFHIHFYKHTYTSVWHGAVFYKCNCGSEKYYINGKMNKGGLKDLLNKKYTN